MEAGVLAAGGIPIGQSDLEDLCAKGIRAILTLTELPITNQREITPELLAKSDVMVLHFPIIDQHPPEIERVAHALEFIDQMRAEGRPVYLHCAAGIGRTGTMLHAYYISQGFSLDQAKEKVKTHKLTSQFLMLSDTQRAFLEQLASIEQDRQ